MTRSSKKYRRPNKPISRRQQNRIQRTQDLKNERKAAKQAVEDARRLAKKQKAANLFLRQIGVCIDAQIAKENAEVVEYNLKKQVWC